MDWTTQCAALIPCRNEAPHIGGLVVGVRNFVPAVFVVDDGSSDETAEQAEAAGAEVIRVATNRGKGAALRIGFQHFRDRGFKWALTLDGDGQHAVPDIPRFFAAAEALGADLVIGNRLGGASAMPRVRLWANRWMSRRLSRRARVSLPDSQCGFRLVRLEALEGLVLKTERFEIESEVLLEFLRAGRKVEFVPVRVIYLAAKSQIRPIRDSFRWLRWWWWDSRH